jgi:murein DD-endopeptidase MepM/ murein hydrolase activator NlpD
MPLNNEDYPIFGEKVFCPINGTVIKVVNNIDDNIPYSGNYPYNTGNTLIIKDGNYYFLIGHLKKGSIRINTGDYVHQNDLLAEVGNSGYSE